MEQVERNVIDISFIIINSCILYKKKKKKMELYITKMKFQ